MREKTEIVRCPNCGGRDVRHSHSRGFWDALLAAFHRVPMRCRMCQRRFYIYRRDEDGEDSTPEPKPEQSKAE